MGHGVSLEPSIALLEVHEQHVRSGRRNLGDKARDSKKGAQVETEGGSRRRRETGKQGKRVGKLKALETHSVPNK